MTRSKVLTICSEILLTSFTLSHFDLAQCDNLFIFERNLVIAFFYSIFLILADLEWKRQRSGILMIVGNKDFCSLHREFPFSDCEILVN